MRHGELDFDTAIGLKELRKRIASADIPPSRLDKTFNLATWNIREFGRRKRRTPSIHYIAEILSQFDLIAITEVRSDLSDLNRVLEILGPYWDIVVSDFGMDRGGNKERIAYVFDKRMIRFTGLAAEADAPRCKVGTEYIPEFDWWRSPYMASFRAGNFDFVVLTVHIRWGGSEAEREVPLRQLAEWVHKRRRDPDVVDKDIIVVGDMNIPDRDSDLFRAISLDGKGLQLPAGLANLTHQQAAANLGRNRTYDQILHYPTRKKRFTDHGGVLDFYQGDISPLYSAHPDLLQRRKFTYELSDHLPLWIQVNAWIEDEQLDAILSRHK